MLILHRNINRHLFALLLISSMLFPCFSAHGESGKAQLQTTAKSIIVVTSNWPPYAIEHSTTEQRGMDVDVVAAAFKQAGITAEFRFYTWLRCFEEMEKERAAAILIINAPGHAKELFLSQPLSTSTGIFLVSKEYAGPPLSTLRDLTGLNIAVVDGYAVSDELTKLNMAYDVSHDEETAIRKVADKRLDVALLELRNARYTLFKLDLTDKFKWHVAPDKYIMRLRVNQKLPDATQLLEAFNSGLNAIIKDGTYDAIRAQYE
jgi:polar amino acid transport system substrate-binding protein